MNASSAVPIDFFSVADVDLAESEMGWMDVYVAASNGSCRVDISNQLLGNPFAYLIYLLTLS